MSELSISMKFEFLPNEILMECFRYLNALDIFYSFDRLNYRFNELIRNIPLHLDFQYIRKSLFDQFCIKMLLNPEIKNQIYSLHLSDKDTCGQINAFLSFFSFDEFSNLQSLSLNENKNSNVEKLESILPISSKLHSLVSERLFNSLTLIDKISSVKNLTISRCRSNQLCQVLGCMPMLNYLKIQNFSIDYESINNDTCFSDYIALNLKRLIIDKFQNDFEGFEKFIKQTPNLKSLTISAENKLNMIDAYRWKNLISSSLPYLNIFKFIFVLDHGNKDIIIEKFYQFQSDFWQIEHHWYIEYSFNDYSVFIYTIPYISDTYELLPFTKRYSDELINNCNTFENVRNLILDHRAIEEKCHWHFSNVKSLKFQNICDTLHHTDNSLEQNFIYSIKLIVNLSNLRHLGFSFYSVKETASVLLEILKEAPKLSSFTIYQQKLEMLYSNHELHSYLNKMIKKLEIKKSNYSSFKTSDEIKQFCEIFSSIEQLKCNINQSDDLLYLISHLSKLSTIEVFVPTSNNSERFFSSFDGKVSKLNIIYEVNDDPYYHRFDRVHEKTLCIWIGGNIN